MNFFKRIKNFILKTLLVLNTFSALAIASGIDSVTTWKPYAVFILNLGFISVFTYVNGYWTDTKPYYERKGKETK